MSQPTHPRHVTEADRRATDEAVRATVLAWDERERIADLRYEDGSGRTEHGVSFDLVRGLDATR